MKCVTCIHFELCAYASHQLPFGCDYYKEPVRHGRWNVEYPTGSDFGRCSACKTLGNLDWHYCPNCGAKMDGNRVEMHTVKQGTDGDSR